MPSPATGSARKSRAKKGTGYFAEYRCIPCGRGSWDEMPSTIYCVAPICCGKPMVRTGRIQKDGFLLTIVAKHKEAA